MKRLAPIALAAISALSVFGLSPLEREVKTLYEDTVFRGAQPESLIGRINVIPSDSVINFSDSIRYAYHYMQAAVMDFEGVNNAEKMVHIDSALQLREKSIGIKDSEYLELLWVKGVDTQETDKTKAMRIFQKGTVVGQSFIEENIPLADVWYGRLLTELGQLYSERGYIDQAISLYREGFQLTSRNFVIDDASSWLPLFQLECLYYNQGEFDKAFAVCEEILKFLSAHGAQQTQHYADVLSFKDNASVGIASKSNEEGVTFLLDGDGTSALTPLMKAKSIYESLNLQNTVPYAITLHNIGRAQMLCNNFKEAKSYLVQSRDLQQNLEGKVLERTQQYLDEVSAAMK